MNCINEKQGDFSLTLNDQSKTMKKVRLKDHRHSLPDGLLYQKPVVRLQDSMDGVTKGQVGTPQNIRSISTNRLV